MNHFYFQHFLLYAENWGKNGIALFRMVNGNHKEFNLHEMGVVKYGAYGKR